MDWRRWLGVRWRWWGRNDCVWRESDFSSTIPTIATQKTRLIRMENASEGRSTVGERCAVRVLSGAAPRRDEGEGGMWIRAENTLYVHPLVFIDEGLISQAFC